jgi:hypothetical protein
LPALVDFTFGVKPLRCPPPPTVGPAADFFENAGIDRIEQIEGTLPPFTPPDAKVKAKNKGTGLVGRCLFE